MVTKDGTATSLHTNSWQLSWATARRNCTAVTDDTTGDSVIKLTFLNIKTQKKIPRGLLYARDQQSAIRQRMRLKQTFFSSLSRLLNVNNNAGVGYANKHSNNNKNVFHRRNSIHFACSEDYDSQLEYASLYVEAASCNKTRSLLSHRRIWIE